MPTTSVSKSAQLAMSWQRAWYERAWWLHLLRPLSWLFQAVACVRRWLYLRQAVTGLVGVPVVVVGNITVGGSGKTPLLIALATELKRRGHRVAVVSRGYGARTQQFPYYVAADTPVSLCGDEPAMLAQRLAVPVVIDPDRPRAIRSLQSNEQYACDVILSDDGLQHYAMARDIEIIVLDAERGLGNGLCLPAGPLRETASRLRSADFLVSNGNPQQLHALRQNFIPMSLGASACVNLRTGERVELGRFFKKQMLHGVAGIGNPARFFTSLRQFGSQVIEHPFPDHHSYIPSDLYFGDALPIVMTEKDAVKCRDFAPANSWYLEVHANLPDSFMDDLHERIGALQSQRKIGIQKNLFGN